MDLDIRTPIGYFFTMVGAILALFGAVPNAKMAEMYAVHSLGINVNLWWGLLLLAFGGFMLTMARRAPKAPRNTGSQVPDDNP